MRSNLARRAAVPVELTGSRAVSCVALVARHRGLDGRPHDRMKKAWRIGARENLDPNQPRGQPDGSARVQPGHDRAVPELPAIPENRQRLRQAKRIGVEATDPLLHPPGDQSPADRPLQGQATAGPAAARAAAR